MGPVPPELLSLQATLRATVRAGEAAKVDLVAVEKTINLLHGVAESGDGIQTVMFSHGDYAGLTNKQAATQVIRTWAAPSSVRELFISMRAGGHSIATENALRQTLVNDPTHFERVGSRQWWLVERLGELKKAQEDAA